VGLITIGLEYALGVLIRAAGELMKAPFDCAVNLSHLLNDDERASLMSLE